MFQEKTKDGVQDGVLVGVSGGSLEPSANDPLVIRVYQEVSVFESLRAEVGSKRKHEEFNCSEFCPPDGPAA